MNGDGRGGPLWRKTAAAASSRVPAHISPLLANEASSAASGGSQPELQNKEYQQKIQQRIDDIKETSDIQ